MTPRQQPVRCIALIRGINVGGRLVPMAELRDVCAALGWVDVNTYIQSGNVLFRATARPPALELALERAIEASFGITTTVLVRTAAAWPRYVASNPFAEVSAREPNLVMLALSKSAPRADALEALRARAAAGERIEQSGDALWIHYDRGVARSRISPGLLDRLVGSPVTTRNWRTVLRLAELAGA